MSTDLSTLTGTYTIDPSHSSVGFTARHAMVTKVRGNFGTFNGKIVLDGANPSASSVTVDIDAASIDTSSPDRDGHLKSPDFFDVATYPSITFTSTAVTQKSDEKYVLTGDLTVHGVTKSVDIDVEFSGTATDPFGNARVGFEGETKISRSEFGLTWNAALETGGFLVSDAIKVELDISAIKEA